MADHSRSERQHVACQLCDRVPSNDRPFICSSCANYAVYNARFSSAQSLLQREQQTVIVDRALKGADYLISRTSEEHALLQFPKSTTNAKVRQSKEQSLDQISRRDEDDNQDELASRQIAYNQLVSERAQTRLRTKAIHDEANAVGDECQYLRQVLLRRGEEMQKRRETIRTGKSAENGLTARMEAITLSSAKVNSRSDLLHAKTADARAYMVREAAHLWGLTVKRKRQRDGRSRDMAYLAGLPVPDLRDLLQARPDQLNASLIAVAYLLNQICSYLALQMPSQLLLPDKDHAWPRIVPVHSSYTDGSIGSTNDALKASGHMSEIRGSARESVSTAHAGHLSEIQTRARALRLQKPLLKLYTEDQLAYEAFVEAMSLLAFNVAWIAKTQAIDVCQTGKGWSWENVCNLGRNLWLLFGPPSRRSEANDTGKETPGAESLVKLGTFSHATSRNNAAGPDGQRLGLREWRLANPNSIIRKVKENLADRKMAGEWELLEEDEWEQDSAPVELREPRDGRDGELSPEPAGAPQHSGTSSGKPARGWQKVRPRNAQD